MRTTPKPSPNASGKPLYKRWWVWVIVVVVLAGAFGGGKGEQQSAQIKGAEAPKAAEHSKDAGKTEKNGAKEPETEKPAVKGSEAGKDAGAEAKTESEAAKSPKPITLVAGEKGEYGKELVMNEERLIVYYVPGGTYSVKNIGKYGTQVTVYEGVRKGDNGDEYTSVSGSPAVIMPGRSADVVVPEGWFIEIKEPSHIELTLK
ncbi:hypothetical protein HLV35_05425 [Eggerthellaceae bacterium zg-997]|nr:hypothetical protein [Eggerthellaceae bacterium zg-997]